MSLRNPFLVIPVPGVASRPVSSEQGTGSAFELRVALRDGERHALLLGVTLSGLDLYCTSQRDAIFGSVIRRSIHGRETGQVNAHFPSHWTQPGRGARIVEEQRIHLADLRGIRHIESGSGDLAHVRWDYRPKADTHKRSTLTIEKAWLPDTGWFVQLYVVEPARRDLIERQLADPLGDVCPLVGHITSGTDPLLFVRVAGIPVGHTKWSVAQLELARQAARVAPGSDESLCPCGSGLEYQRCCMGFYAGFCITQVASSAFPRWRGERTLR